MVTDLGVMTIKTVSFPSARPDQCQFSESELGMHRSRLITSVLVCAMACTVTLTAAETATETAPRVIAGFRLNDPAGEPFELMVQTSGQMTVVCFLGTECPLARYYGPRLSQLSKDFDKQKVRFIGINSNSQDSPKEVAQYVRDYDISFPVLKDPGNKVADQFGARTMSEVYILDHNLAVRYHGRVDDQYLPGVARSQPTRHDLRIALEELMAGKQVSVSETQSIGCSIGRVKVPASQSDVTFCNQVSRILNAHCVECHRVGEIGPFSLTDYDEVTGWGDTILETIEAGRMPPWNANPSYGHFQNSRLMPESDKALLREWVAAGMPLGDQSQLPKTPEYSSGWQLPREPDLVLKMRDRPFKIPATGTVEYQYFVVDPQFTEDRWVSASQVIPGNRPTVHHSILFVRPPDGTDVRGVGYLTGYVPGQRSFALPPGYARKVPAGSKFVFQMHYTPNGLEQEDITQVGMTFIPESEVKHEVFTLLGIDQEFEIPPNTSDYAVPVKLGWLPKRAELLAIVPHMHVRGKSFQATIRRGDQTEVLLDVPRYDFNWQHVYELQTPIKLGSVDALEYTAHFDNSRNNPANPDPTQTVYWGDQTWEEMAVAFFEVAEPRDALSEPEPQRNKQKLVMKSGPEKGTQESPEAFVADFFKRFDKNQDGVVEKTETPIGFRTYAFRDFDANGDGKLSRDEIEAESKRPRRRRR